MADVRRPYRECENKARGARVRRSQSNTPSYTLPRPYLITPKMKGTVVLIPTACGPSKFWGWQFTPPHLNPPISRSSNFWGAWAGSGKNIRKPNRSRVGFGLMLFRPQILFFVAYSFQYFISFFMGRVDQTTEQGGNGDTHELLGRVKIFSSGLDYAKKHSIPFSFLIPHRWSQPFKKLKIFLRVTSLKINSIEYM